MKFHDISSRLVSISIAIIGMTSFSALTFVPTLTAPAIAQTIGEKGEPVTTRSTPQAIALAKHLRKIGAKVYTAYWCPHCHDQKERFGQEATSQLDIIECDQRGFKPQRQLCIAKKIRGFPTWEINGRFYEGDRTLENLANLSRYRGDI
ncbi:protein disulfide isomerase family protein [Pseudanabaena sp. ABRG5-3]|uniref:protein disulfide isomerase family protein n=1 Tax=Pseudanabaena sp. ABRG5-3 TaxID=685565 RepID=UPI000F844092|nr:protein disulfide isomerase family protein [Pseudanabaena sp. ABRG5-3]